MQNNPLVSICIPTYNGEAFIQEALDSALAQSYKPIEIIISDDNSTDNTLRIVNEIAKKSTISIKIFNHKPSGIGANWNHCIRNAKGNYIKFLFQDDLLEPNCIEEMVRLAENSEMKLGLVFSKRDIIGVLKEQDRDGYEQIVYPEIVNGAEVLKNKNLYSHPRNKIGEPSSVLLPKYVFDEVGYFNENLKQSLDYEFWYRICHNYSIGYVDKSLANFRVHGMQTTKLNSVKVTNDRYLLPLLFLKQHFKLLHIKVVLTLVYKFIAGYIAFKVNALKR